MSGYPFGSGPLGAKVRRQGGAITRRQLLDAGLSRRQIDGMVSSGLLSRRYRGIYLLANAEAGWRPQLHAALLLLGDRAVLSHRTAGALWGLCDRASQIEAIRPNSGATPPRALTVRRIDTLADDEWIVLDGLRVTTVARTLLDLATVLEETGLAAAFEVADRQGRVRHAAIRRVLDRGGRKGVTALRRLYKERDPLRRPTRSDFEHFVKEAMRKRARFELPETNVPIAGREVDMLWRRKRLMVELDGHRHHAGEASFNSDRARDLAMETRGWRVLRVSWAMWQDDPNGVLDSIESILRSLPEQEPQSSPR